MCWYISLFACLVDCSAVAFVFVVYVFVRSLVRSFVSLLDRSVVRLFVCLFVYSFVRCH